MLFRRLDRRWWVMLNVSVGIYMSTLDASVVNISLPTILNSMDTNVRTLAWVVTGYLIVITGCLLLMGGLADLLGQKKVYLLGFVTFTVGSGLCGISPTIHFLIGSRVVQGLGAAALMAIGPAITTTAFPEKDRGQVLGIVGSIVSIGFLTGPVIGGFLVEHLGWRSVFFVNLPVGVVGIFLSLRVMEDKLSKGKVPVDLWGALLFFVFMTSLLLFLNRVSQGTTHLFWPWLLFCLLSFMLFVAVELRIPAPLVDLHIFKKQLFSVSLAASLFSFWVSGAHNFVIPFFLQSILKFAPSQVGMLVFPVALTVMIVAPLGGRVSDRVGVRVPATVGLILISLSILSFSIVRGEMGELDIIWRQVLMGLGVGLFNPANNSAIIGSLPRDKIGLASSFLALARNLGMVIGVAFAETVISLKAATLPSGSEKGFPTLDAIHAVWKWVFIMGMMAVVLSWIRSKTSGNSHEKSGGPSGR